MVSAPSQDSAQQVAGAASEAEIRVAMLRGADVLGSEERDWRRLARDADLLMQFEWVDSWRKAFVAPVEFLLLKATRGGEAIGYLPLVRSRIRWRRLPVTMLSLCANEHSTWGGLLLPPRQSSAVAAAFGRFLLEWRAWDMLQLPRLPMLPTRARHLLDALLAADAAVVSKLEYQRVLHLPERWDDYLGSLSRNFRGNLASTRKRLGRLGRWTVTVTATESETVAAFAVLVAVDERSWKSRNGETIASRPDAHAFYKSLVEAFARQGRCWIALLESEGEAISAALFFEHDGIAFGLKSSSDAAIEAGSVSAGHLALIHALEEAHRRGLRTVQLLSGAPTWERYKGTLEPVLSGQAYNRHAYARAVRLADCIARGTKKTPPRPEGPVDRRRRQPAAAGVNTNHG